MLQRTALLAAPMLAAASPLRTFTVYSQPVELRYGEVHNRVQTLPSPPGGAVRGFPLPDDVVQRYRTRNSTDGPNSGSMAIKGWTLDIVRKTSAGELPVPLYDHYNHHYILHMGGEDGVAEFLKKVTENPRTADMQGKGLARMQRGAAAESVQWVDFGGASGAEFRHNPHSYPAPFRTVIHRPEVWAPELHIINTWKPESAPFYGDVSPLLQCPCTPQRRIDPTNGTIDGKVPDPAFGCSAAMKAAGNPSCGLETYQGGWRCCEHGVMLLDTSKCSQPNCAEYPRDTVYVKFTFEYEDATEEHRPLHSQACCDVTSDRFGDGNIEYDVPKCAEGTAPEDCVFAFETVQAMDYYEAGRNVTLPNGTSIPESDLEVDLVYAAPHLHVTGLSLSMIDHVTNEVLCEVTIGAGITYGNGTSPGDERNYLTGLYPCVWEEGKAPRRKRSHPIRTRAVYNATSRQTGVMALWLNQVANVDP